MGGELVGATAGHVPDDIREPLLKRWLDVTFAVYPKATMTLLNSGQDRFCNPVGETIRAGLSELLDEIVGPEDCAEMPAALDRIVRIRSVQELAVADALRFLVDLKPILAEFESRLATIPRRPDHATLCRRIDRLTLAAFERYLACREQMFRIQANEDRARNAKLITRAQQILHDHLSGQEEEMKHRLASHPPGGGKS